MVCYSHLFQNFPQFVVIHTVKAFGIVNKAEIDVFLELSCFFDDPADVGNLISGSSAFSKSSLYMWKFLVHLLLKPSLKDFEYYLTKYVKWEKAMAPQAGSKSGKEYIKAVYCHPSYLTCRVHYAKCQAG